MAERDQPEGEGAMTIDGTFSLGDCLTPCNVSTSLVLAPLSGGAFLWPGFVAVTKALHGKIATTPYLASLSGITRESEMKRLLIAALLALVPAVASANAAPSIPTVNLPNSFIKHEFISCSPTWFWLLPKQERAWISRRIVKSKYIWTQTFHRLVISYNRELLKLDYGKPGYAEHKAAFLMFRAEVLLFHPIQHASWSTCTFISHVEKRLAYQYQHHDYLSPSAKNRAEELAAQKASADQRAAVLKQFAEQAAASAQPSAENQRLSALFGNQIGERIKRHWNPVWAPSLHCQIKIELSPQGQLEGPPIITHSSGNAKFDVAVVTAIDAAAPFAPPSGLPYSEFKVVNVVFSAKELSNG